MNDKREFLFVDTSVLVYAHDRSAGRKHSQADGLIREIWESRMGCLSIQILREFYVIITQRVPNPLAPEEAAGIIQDLGLWRVHQPDVEDLLGAIDIQTRYRLSVWESLVIRSALQLNCKRLFSENFTAGQRFYGLQVVNPFVDSS